MEEYLLTCFHVANQTDENDTKNMTLNDFRSIGVMAPDPGWNTSYMGTYHNDSHVGYLIGTECHFHPNTALLTAILMFGTFLLAFMLRKFRASTFLSSKVRRTIGDFGVPIAIVAMVLAQLGATDVYTQKD